MSSTFAWGSSALLLLSSCNFALQTEIKAKVRTIASQGSDTYKQPTPGTTSTPTAPVTPPVNQKAACAAQQRGYNSSSNSCEDCASLGKTFDAGSVTCIDQATTEIPNSMTIRFPIERAVFQRSLSNQGKVLVEGSSIGDPSRVEARLVARANGGGATSAWQPLTLSGGGNYSGRVQAQGGWYDLEIRSYKNSTQVGFGRLSRVGVGEVFVLAGQSNQFGGNSDNYFGTDDRVNVLNYETFYKAPNMITAEKVPNFFSQAGKGMNAGPLGAGFIWGGLGDKLIQRL
ncbi:MAG: hypothetical protein EOP09_14455, partial [Proteobacteria bacterium]